MNIFKKIVIAIFCPIWFLFDHNGSKKLTQTKYESIKYLIIAIVVALVVVFVYYLNKEIL